MEFVCEIAPINSFENLKIGDVIDTNFYLVDLAEPQLYGLIKDRGES
jgi:hypothetical protein